jgi:hypothetical protein
LWSRSIAVTCIAGGISTPGQLMTASKTRCDLSRRRWPPGKLHIHVAYSNGFSTSLVRSHAFVLIQEPPGLPSRAFTRIVSTNSTYVSPPPTPKPQKVRLPTLPLLQT